MKVLFLCRCLLKVVFSVGFFVSILCVIGFIMYFFGFLVVIRVELKKF